MRKNFVGIDVSKAKLDFAIGSEKTSTFKNSEEGILEAIKWLEENTSHPLKIVIESTSWYHWVACLMLKEEGFDVRSINPIITKKYQRSSIRDCKNDRIDAIRLAEIAKLEPNLPKFFDSRGSLKNKRFHSLLKKLEKVKQELNRSLVDATKSFEALGVTIDLTAIEEALKSIKTAIRVCKRIIENSADEFALRLSRVRGISLFQATMIATSIAGRKFESREKIVAFFGLDVRVRQSGT
jgi:transposase